MEFYLVICFIGATEKHPSSPNLGDDDEVTEMLITQVSFGPNGFKFNKGSNQRYCLWISDFI